MPNNGARRLVKKNHGGNQKGFIKNIIFPFGRNRYFSLLADERSYYIKRVDVVIHDLLIDWV